MRARWALAAVALAVVLPLATGCTAPVTPAPLTQRQLDAITAADNDSRWAFFFGDRPDVQRPDVHRLAYVPSHKAEAYYKSCLRAANVDPDLVYGFAAYDSGPVATRAYLEYYTCVAEFPVNPLEIGYLSRAQLDFMYDYYTDRLAPCLRLLGYQVTAPPPREEFVATALPGQAWDPYARVHPIPGKFSWAAIDARCPPLPAGTYGTPHP